jgi:hypothetical protein
VEGGAKSYAVGHNGRYSTTPICASTYFGDLIQDLPWSDSFHNIPSLRTVGLLVAISSLLRSPNLQLIFRFRGNWKTVIMPATTPLFRAARPAFRPNFFSQQVTRQTRTRFGGRRWQSTAAPAEPVQQSLFKKLWDSPVGLKTVHFWYAASIYLLTLRIAEADNGLGRLL